jgi:hypothetical protein
MAGPWLYVISAASGAEFQLQGESIAVTLDGTWWSVDGWSRTDIGEVDQRKRPSTASLAICFGPHRPTPGSGRLKLGRKREI